MPGNPPPAGPPGAIAWNGSFSLAQSPVYGSGGSSNLDLALQALYSAQQLLASAKVGGRQGDYARRTATGLQMAIADVKLAYDTADGRPTPPDSALPHLPEGVGNTSSVLQVVPTRTLVASTPDMDGTVAALNHAMDALNHATWGNKGVFLPRAMADVRFALDNAIAAINVANGQPASLSKPGANPAPASPPLLAKMKLSTVQTTWVVLGLFILLAIAFEIIWRAKR